MSKLYDDNVDLFEPRLHEKRKTTEEAMDVLREHKDDLILLAREIADELIVRHGSTSTKNVFAIMFARGLIDENEKAHWLGAVFRDSRYSWTGRWDESFVSAKTHASRPVKIWRRKAAPT